MSLNGTQPVKAGLVGSQAVLNPAPCRICCANPTHGAANGFCSNAPAIAGFNPPGRKKLTRAADTQGCPPDPTPHGAAPAPTNNGPPEAFEVESVSAACQFLTNRSPRGVLALM